MYTIMRFISHYNYSLLQHPIDTSSDMDSIDKSELEGIASVDASSDLVSKKSETQNNRRQLTKQKIRRNLLRRQRVNNRKAATPIRKKKQPINTLKNMGDRYDTEMESVPIDGVRNDIKTLYCIFISFKGTQGVK